VLIEISEVSKEFKKQKVLSDINLAIHENEIFGLIGPSGSGKTTLIRLMLGAIKADRGKIRVMDCLVPDLKILDSIGYMPQNDALYNDLSGYDNLKFFGGMYHRKSHELQQRMQEVLKLVDLERDSRKKVSNYSGGMRKRLSLAIALLHNPRILILDEPTVGIDPILRQKIWKEFDLLKKQGKTIIVTTHVMDEAMKCDRLGLIYKGEVIACDFVRSLLDQTESHTIEELFLIRGGAQE
jgi:ABC-2 type transport system ATP-binding protein